MMRAVCRYTKLLHYIVSSVHKVERYSEIVSSLFDSIHISTLNMNTAH